MMRPKKEIRVVILNIARIWSILSLGFLIFMLGGHIVGEIKGSPDNISGFQNTREMFVFICFPISTIVGLAVAWRFEALGGVITILGMVGLYALRPDLLAQWVLLILPAPGVLFLAYWLITINQTESEQPD